MNAAVAIDFRLERDPFGHLVLIDAEGVRHEGVVPVRAFPLSAPHEGLSLVGAGGHELVWIERFDDLPQDARALIEEELAGLQFVPEIKRLESVSSFSTPSIWQVETDRGATRFVLKSEDDIRRLPDGRLLIAGGAGVNYLVRDRAALDRGSRKLLERFL
ncbi:MAG: DUF1854 domain-containing protein [Burkholderiales bacterium]